MARTTAGAVGGIVAVDGVAWPSITPFIDTANAIVTQHCTASGYTDATLELIERWLAAHFYCIADAERQGESVDGVQETKFGKVELGFRQTRYGQQALLLDYKNNLASLQNTQADVKKKTVSATWLGIPADDQEAFE